MQVALDIRLKDIPENGRDLHVPYSPVALEEALAGKDAEVSRSRVDANLHLSRLGETVDVHGRLTGDVQLACARCLGEAHVALDVPLRIVIGPEDLGGEDSVSSEAESNGVEVEYFTHDGDVIHLGDVLREALILAVPMTTLCRESCNGLCIVCGGDRNERDCGHDQTPPDPRFAALEELKKNLKI